MQKCTSIKKMRMINIKHITKQNLNKDSLVIYKQLNYDFHNDIWKNVIIGNSLL